MTGCVAVFDLSVCADSSTYPSLRAFSIFQHHSLSNPYSSVRLHLQPPLLPIVAAFEPPSSLPYPFSDIIILRLQLFGFYFVKDMRLGLGFKCDFTLGLG